MTRTEVDLVAALFIIYAYDCVHWMGPDDQAFTRSSSRAWKNHRRMPLGFTLLGRNPLVVDPFLALPGFIQCRSSVLPSAPSTERALRKVAVNLDRFWVIELQCRVQAMLFLLFLPWIVFTHRLLLLWPTLLAVVLLNHILLMVSFWRALRQSSIPRPFAIMAPLLINPLGASRLLDALSQAIFDRRMTRLRMVRTNLVDKTVN